MLALVVSYLLGGVTFLPLVLVLIVWRGSSTDKPFKAPVQRRPLRGERGLAESGVVAVNGDADVKGWLFFSDTYIAMGELGEPSLQTPAASARKSLQKLVSADAQAGSGTITVYKALAKLPKYWAVVRSGQLQLFTDELEAKMVDCLQLTDFVAMLWPQKLEEFELFYRKYPIALVSRMGRHGIVELDLEPGVAPREAFYFYCENPTVKEDFYFALISHSRMRNADESLGPRDPVDMAQPITVSKTEIQELQSRIWSTSEPRETQWLNALLGRLFLELKDSRLVEDYLKRKITYKLRPVSANPYVGPVEVKKVTCGSSIPFINNVKLRQLTPDGDLVVEADISYRGGFCVNLGTTVSLSVGAFRAAEFPVELACTVQELEGTVVLHIKPSPSSRIWYAFDTMPKLDLLLEPAVYDTRVSYSLVTNYLRNMILETVKETLVMPFMDDLAFYDTTDEFYRGGVWDHRTRPTAQGKATRETIDEMLAQAPPADSQARVLRRRVSSSASVASSASSTQGSKAAADDEIPAALNYIESAANANSTVRRFSQWVKRKRSAQSLRSIFADESLPEGATNMTSVTPTTSGASKVSFSTKVNDFDGTSLAPPAVATTQRPVSPATSAVNAQSPTKSRDQTEEQPIPLSPSRTTRPLRPSVYRKPVPPSLGRLSEPEFESDLWAESKPPSDVPSAETLGLNTNDSSSARSRPKFSSLDLPASETFLGHVATSSATPVLSSTTATASMIPEDHGWRDTADSVYQLRQLSRSPSLRSSGSSSGRSAKSEDSKKSGTRNLQQHQESSQHNGSGSIVQPVGSTRKPVPPPRRRKVVLKNVPPEPDSRQ